LLFLERGHVRMSRSVPTSSGPELATEIERSLPLAGWSYCETVWVSGDETPEFRSSFRRGCLGVAIAAPPLGKTATRLLRPLPIDERSSALLALAVAAGGAPPPPPPRPPPPPPPAAPPAARPPPPPPARPARRRPPRP